MQKKLRNFLEYAKKVGFFGGKTNSEVGIFGGINYEPLSDPPPLPPPPSLKYVSGSPGPCTYHAL